MNKLILFIIFASTFSCTSRYTQKELEVFKKDGQEFYLAREVRPFRWILDSPAEMRGEIEFWGLLENRGIERVPRIGWFRQKLPTGRLVEGFGVFTLEFSVEYEKAKQINKEIFKGKKYPRRKLQYAIITNSSGFTSGKVTNFVVNKERNKYRKDIKSQIFTAIGINREFKGEPLIFSPLNQIQVGVDSELELLKAFNKSDIDLFEQYFKPVSMKGFAKDIGIPNGLFTSFPRIEDLLLRKKVSKNFRARAEKALFHYNYSIDETWLNFEKYFDRDLLIRLPSPADMIRNMNLPENQACYGKQKVFVLNGICSLNRLQFPIAIAKPFNQESFIIEVWENHKQRQSFFLRFKRRGWSANLLDKNEVFTFEEARDLLLGKVVERKLISRKLEKRGEFDKLQSCKLLYELGAKSENLIDFPFDAKERFFDFTKRLSDYWSNKTEQKLINRESISLDYQRFTIENLKRDMRDLELHLDALRLNKEFKDSFCAANTKEFQVQIENGEEILNLKNIIIAAITKDLLPLVQNFEIDLKKKVSFLSRKQTKDFIEEFAKKLNTEQKIILDRLESDKQYKSRVRFIRREYDQRVQRNVFNGARYVPGLETSDQESMFYIYNTRDGRNQKLLDIEFKELVSEPFRKELQPKDYGAMFTKVKNKWRQIEFFETDYSKLDDPKKLGIYDPITPEAISYCWVEGDYYNCYGPFGTTYFRDRYLDRALKKSGCLFMDKDRTKDFRKGKIFYCNYGLRRHMIDITYRYDLDHEHLNARKEFRCIRNHVSFCDTEFRIIKE